MTRNLLYRYFPRGRTDVFIAVVDHAVVALNRGYVTDPRLPIAQRHVHNLTLIATHTLTPTDPWRIYTDASGTTTTEIREFVTVLRTEWAIRTALNNGLPPNPHVLAMLLANQAGATELLEQARHEQLALDWTIRMLVLMQAATIAALSNS